MATLANIFSQFMSAGSVSANAPRSVTWETSEEFKLRAIPNEDIYLFSKRIDNSRVVRQADPKARARDWKFVGGAGFASLALITMLLPSAYGLIAGYQLNQLELEGRRLAAERVQLELKEARLLSVERLQELAAMQDFIDPAPERTVYLEPKGQQAVAQNR